MSALSKRIAVLGIAPLLAGSLCIAGCGGAASSSSSANASATSSMSGTASNAESASQANDESSSLISVTLKNETGADISSIAVKATGASEYDGTHTFDGFAFADGTSTDITFQQILVDGKPATSYDLKFVTSNDAIMEMPGLDLANLKEVTLKFDDSVGYVEYTDAESGETVNNKEESEQRINESTENVETYDQKNQLG